jgi:hypothetical protein
MTWANSISETSLTARCGEMRNEIREKRLYRFSLPMFVVKALLSKCKWHLSYDIIRAVPIFIAGSWLQFRPIIRTPKMFLLANAF